MEGNTDEALKVKKSPRRKKTSFSKSGDEEVKSSSENEETGDHLVVNIEVDLCFFCDHFWQFLIDFAINVSHNCIISPG